MKRLIPKSGRACRGGCRDISFFGAPSVWGRFNLGGLNDQIEDLGFRLVRTL